MKKFVLFVLLLTIGVTLFGAEPGTILTLTGSHPITGKVTEMEIVHDLYGGAYVLYINDGEFNVLRKTAAGLTPYEPEGFGRRPKQARNLCGFEGTSEQYTAFIGKEGDREELFLFGVNHRGELVYYPLRESGTAGTISGYSLSCILPDEVQIYILGDKQLYCLSLGESPETMKRLYPVSLPGEKVTEFETVLQFGQDKVRGWYTALSDGLWKLSLFSMGENGFLIREQAGTFHAPPEVPPVVIAGEDDQGDVIYKIINDNDVMVYRGNGTGFFRDFSFKSPGTVKNYLTINGSGDGIDLLLAGEGESDVIYMVSRETSFVPVLEPLAVMEKDSFLNSKLLASTLNDDQICLFFSRNGKPCFSINGLRSGTRMTGDFGDTEAASVFCYSGDSDVLKVCILELHENPSLLIYRYDQNTWALERKIPIPIETKNKTWLPETALIFNPFYTESGIIFLAADDRLFLYDPDRELYQELEKRKHRWSRKMNGIMYAALTGESGIELYRMEG
jgi:hypothetical protein